MSDDLLQDIQTLQFSDKNAAESLLHTFIAGMFGLTIVSVELRPLAVSLNSFNGFLTLTDGRQLFFKTHTEPDNVIGEYYNAAALAEAGYPVIQPIMSSTEAGKQLLIYEVIASPSVFDVAWQIENGSSLDLPLLTQAQEAADKYLFDIYIQTLAWQSAEDAAKSPIHQLFFHRLIGGRLERFYGALPEKNEEDDTQIEMPFGVLSMRQVRQMQWVINGSIYRETLDDLIIRSNELLNPTQAGASIIGHGDAHNGNVFFRRDQNPPSLLYFDPAFAGRHHPLLDLTKPLFHNVFAMWMYYPHEKREETSILCEIRGNTLDIQHDYDVPSVRHMFLQSKVQHVLIPILQELKRQGWLNDNWRAYLKAALFCCPFLTMDLTDRTKFSPEISLLGLSMAVQMGGESQQVRSLIDQTFDEVAMAL